MSRKMYENSYMCIRKLVLSVAVLAVIGVTYTSCAGGATPVEADQTDGAVVAEVQAEATARNRTAEERQPADSPRRDETRETDGVRRAPSSPAAGTVPIRPELDERTETIDAIVDTMTLEELVGQLVMPAYLYDRRGVAVTSVVPDLAAMLETVQPGGFLLFAPNIVDPEQVRALVSGIQERVAVPMIIGIDQEGGIVRRLVPTESMPVTDIPAASQVGRSGDERLAFELAGVVARELRSLGITMNLAPVADVLTNPDNPVIGSRSYGNDPDVVGRMVAATVKGLQSHDVSAALKHFPGHGDTVEDSHVGLAAVRHTMSRLEAVELEPFERGIAAGADAVLTGHISVPEITGDTTPATLSATITKGLLRKKLGFDGVVITDALTMGALTNNYGSVEIPLLAVNAGADILLRPGDPVAAAAAIITAVDRGEIEIARIKSSVRRILDLKYRRGLIRGFSGKDDPDGWRAVYRRGTDEPLYYIPRSFVPDQVLLGTEAHRAVAEEIVQRSRR